MIKASICLTDIPKERIRVSETNGKAYVELIISKRKEVDKYGNTHSVEINRNKTERENNVPKVYVGNAIDYGNQKANNTNTNQPSASPVDDLPF
jgi:hypothetical protein